MYYMWPLSYIIIERDGIIVSTPAKKTVPSLKDLTAKKDDDKNQDVTDSSNKDNVVSNDNVDATKQDNPETVVENENDKSDKDVEQPRLSQNVVGTVPNKTPSELAAETPDETAARYGIDQKINDDDADNPRVQVYRDTYVQQVPSGTHLHPDVAKDLQNRGISERTTDSAQVKRQVTETYHFADAAENNDKF